MLNDPFAHLPDEFEWERESPTIYLGEAFSALLDLFDPYGPQKLVGGAYHRMRWARIAAMFAAFAAEGFINRTLRSHLKTRDFEAIDRLSTVDKYAIGPRLAFQRDIFDRGQEPLQTLAELFDLRNRLAHPKPRSETISRAELFAGPDADTFSPTRTVRFVVATAEAARALRTATDGAPDVFVDTVVQMKPQFLALAAQAELLPKPTYHDYREALTRLLRDA